MDTIGGWHTQWHVRLTSVDEQDNQREARRSHWVQPVHPLNPREAMFLAITGPLVERNHHRFGIGQKTPKGYSVGDVCCCWSSRETHGINASFTRTRTPASAVFLIMSMNFLKILRLYFLTVLPDETTLLGGVFPLKESTISLKYFAMNSITSLKQPRLGVMDEKQNNKIKSLWTGTRKAPKMLGKCLALFKGLDRWLGRRESHEYDAIYVLRCALISLALSCTYQAEVYFLVVSGKRERHVLTQFPVFLSLLPVIMREFPCVGVV